MKTLYVLGCSFATPNFCVEPKESFWGNAGRDLKVDRIVNFAHSGFSLDILIHILLNEDIDFENNHLLFGIPPLARINIFQDQSPPIEHNYKEYDKNFKEVDIKQKSLTNVRWLGYDEIFGDEKKFIGNLDYNWLTVEGLNKILLVHNYLTAKKINFIIANLTVPMLYQDPWPTGEEIMRKTKNLKECILFENTPWDVNKKDNIRPVDRNPSDPDCWFGHHGAEGNFNWYNKVLKKKMQELQWIQ